MADLMSGAQSNSGQDSLGMGLMNYFGKIQANKNARAVDATNRKWAPLLALNKSKGAQDEAVPSASFAEIMGPALNSMMNSSTLDSEGLENGGVLQGSAGGGAPPTSEELAGGGKVPKYAGGGQQQDSGGGIGSLIQTGMKLAPLIAMMLDKGGQVPGKGPYPGDTPKNDLHPAMLSSEEVVLPKTVAKAGMNGNKWKVAAYLNEVKKHGPGPMSTQVSTQIAKAKSPPSGGNLSPWAAMAKGGKMGC